MWVSGHANFVFLVGGLLLAGVLVILSSMFFVGHFKPRILYRVFLILQKVLNRIIGVFKKSMKPAWGRTTAHSFIDTANLLAKNPKGTAITVVYASFSAILNMACLVAIGYAFGFEMVEALIAAFAVGAISVILSPTPQGVGVVEAMIIAILTAYGCPAATAAAIALVYRGIMFWIPFCIGAVLLSQSGFFKSKKTDSELQKQKDIGWISGVLVFLLGVVNIFYALAPDVLLPYTMLTSWVDMSSLFVGIPLIISSLFLIVCAVGLVMRFRTAWALTISALVLIAGVEFAFRGTWHVSLVCIALFVWMFWRRDAFDRPFSMEAVQADLRAWRSARIERAAKKAEKSNGATAGDFDAPQKDAREENVLEGRSSRSTPPDWHAQAERGREIGTRVIGQTNASMIDGERKSS
jgi:phosphatidylglycerol lysyltransferase